MLTDQQVKKFQKLYKKHFNKELSRKEAFRRGTELADLIKMLLASSSGNRKNCR